MSRSPVIQPEIIRRQEYGNRSDVARLPNASKRGLCDQPLFEVYSEVTLRTSGCNETGAKALTRIFREPNSLANTPVIPSMALFVAV